MGPAGHIGEMARLQLESAVLAQRVPQVPLPVDILSTAVSENPNLTRGRHRFGISRRVMTAAVPFVTGLALMQPAHAQETSVVQAELASTFEQSAHSVTEHANPSIEQTTRLYPESLEEGPPVPPDSFLDVDLGDPTDEETLITITVTEATGPGFIQVVLPGQENLRGTYSNGNVSYAGQTVAMNTLVKGNEEGKIRIYTQGGGQIIVDKIAETVTDPSVGPLFEMLPVTHRALDTRNTEGHIGPLPAGAITAVKGEPGTKVLLNMTATDTLIDGYVEVLSAPDEVPGARSNLNAARGNTVSSLSTAEFNDDGLFWIYNQNPTELVVDILANINVSGDNYHDIIPFRELDSRESRTTPIPAGSMTVLGGLEPNSMAAIRLVATESVLPGYVQVMVPGKNPGDSSSLNTGKGETVGIWLLAPVDTNGNAMIFNQVGMHLVADVQGYFPGATFKALGIRVEDTRDDTPPPQVAPRGTLVLLSSIPGNNGDDHVLPEQVNFTCYYEQYGYPIPGFDGTAQHYIHISVSGLDPDPTPELGGDSGLRGGYVNVDLPNRDGLVATDNAGHVSVSAKKADQNGVATGYGIASYLLSKAPLSKLQQWQGTITIRKGQKGEKPPASGNNPAQSVATFAVSAECVQGTGF